MVDTGPPCTWSSSAVATLPLPHRREGVRRRVGAGRAGRGRAGEQRRHRGLARRRPRRRPRRRRAARRGLPSEHRARQLDAECRAPTSSWRWTSPISAPCGARCPTRAGAPVALVRPRPPACAEVPDPYYGGDDGFAEVLAMIQGRGAGDAGLGAREQVKVLRLPDAGAGWSSPATPRPKPPGCAGSPWRADRRCRRCSVRTRWSPGSYPTGGRRAERRRGVRQTARRAARRGRGRVRRAAARRPRRRADRPRPDAQRPRRRAGPMVRRDRVLP